MTNPHFIRKGIATPSASGVLQALVSVAVALLLSLQAAAQPAKGLAEIGMVYFKEKRYAEALERFDQAHQLEPDNTLIRRNIANCHQFLASEAVEADNMPMAMHHLKQAIFIDPKNPSPRVQAGGYWLSLGELHSARDNLNEALKLSPDHLEAQVLLGEALYQEGDFKGATKRWEVVLEKKPDWPGLKEKLAKLGREAVVESDFQSYRSPHFELRYGEALSDETRDLIFKLLEEAYQDIGKALGGIYPQQRVAVVLYDGKEFAEATGSDERIGALYDGKIRAPITSKRNRYLSKATLTSRLRHEYVHVALREKLGVKVPWWLNEGLAETLSREMDQNRIRTLRKAYGTAQNLPFAELEDNPRERLKPNQVSLAYAQAHVAVKALWKEKQSRFPSFLDALLTAETPEDALKQTLKTDYAKLDHQTRAACGANSP